MGRFVFIAGLVIAGIGLLVMSGVPLGRLPGDITIRRGSFAFHFPVVTSIIVSILLTLFFSFFRR